MISLAEMPALWLMLVSIFPEQRFPLDGIFKSQQKPVISPHHDPSYYLP
jgi:hypothetical protein